MGMINRTHYLKIIYKMAGCGRLNREYMNDERKLVITDKKIREMSF
jgi:hypothetical protein